MACRPVPACPMLVFLTVDTFLVAQNLPAEVSSQDAGSLFAASHERFVDSFRQIAEVDVLAIWSVELLQGVVHS